MSAALSLFEPRRLISAVQRAVELHPATANSAQVPDPDTLPALRRRLVAAKRDGALESFAAELSPRQVRNLISGLQLWEDLRDDVLSVLKLRILPGHAPLLWQAWQQFPTLEPLKELLLSLDSDSWKFLPPPIALAAPRWIGANIPGVTVVEWLDGQNLRRRDLSKIGGARITENTPFAALVLEGVLTHGSSSMLLAETPSTIVQASRELDLTSTRQQFALNYLKRIEPPGWNITVAAEIQSSYGLPRRPHIRGFWEQLPEGICKSFQRLFIERELRRFFGDATERHRYWTRWIDAFDDVHTGSVHGTDYAILLFPSFGVVEFFELGNAAYFYDREHAESYTRRPVYRPEDLKDQSRGERLIHHVSWQWNADLMVGRWMRDRR